MVSLSDSGFEGILFEIETAEPVCILRVCGRLCTEPGHNFRMYRWSIVAHGLPGGPKYFTSIIRMGYFETHTATVSFF
jgi:hypothetical protein